MFDSLTERISYVDTEKVRIELIDDKGRLTFAMDKGYAVVVKTYSSGLLVKEEYYDEHDNPQIQKNGSYGILFTYNDNNLAKCITFIDKHGNPTIVNEGYSSIQRTYYDDGKLDSELYFIGDNQVKTAEGYYRYRQRYENNQIIIEYLDQDNNLFTIPSGYSFIVRTVNEKGKPLIDEYFDRNGNQTTSKMGAYAYYQEYDEKDRVIFAAYLDDEGNYTNISTGFSIIRTIYNDYGFKKLFFDASDHPVTIGAGQYGLEYKGEKVNYLNKNGEPLLRIDNILNGSPWLVMAFGLLLMFVGSLLQGKFRYLYTIAYTCFIVIMTLLYREPHAGRGMIYFSVGDVVHDRLVQTSIINNIWLFVPLGTIFSNVCKKRWYLPVFMSILIEIIQLFTGFGTFEFVDIICNSLGTLTGYIFANEIFRTRLMQIGAKKRNE